jgi:transcription factor E
LHLKRTGLAGTSDVAASVLEKTRKSTIHANIASEDMASTAIRSLAANDSAVNYLKKNISKRSLDVLNMLSVPKTDDDIAQQLDMKINAVRRMLNLMQGCGITNYYVAKNVNGWLSFAWYVNVDKVPSFLEYAEGLENRKPLTLTDCNDYFICNDCYSQNGLIFTFDAAFEGNFKCGVCGSGLEMIGKEKALELTESKNNQETREPADELSVEADV